MVLSPSEGDVVIHCDGGSTRIFARAEWDANKSAGSPLAVLTEADGAALAWFLRYWIGEHKLQPGYNMRAEVNAQFHY